MVFFTPHVVIDGKADTKRLKAFYFLPEPGYWVKGTKPQTCSLPNSHQSERDDDRLRRRQLGIRDYMGS